MATEFWMFWLCNVSGLRHSTISKSTLHYQPNIWVYLNRCSALSLSLWLLFGILWLSCFTLLPFVRAQTWPHGRLMTRCIPKMWQLHEDVHSDTWASRWLRQSSSRPWSQPWTCLRDGGQARSHELVQRNLTSRASDSRDIIIAIGCNWLVHGSYVLQGVRPVCLLDCFTPPLS